MDSISSGRHLLLEIPLEAVSAETMPTVSHLYNVFSLVVTVAALTDELFLYVIFDRRGFRDFDKEVQLFSEVFVAEIFLNFIDVPTVFYEECMR